jgi:hypothetical protein
VDFLTPLSNDEDRVDAYHNGEPLQYRSVEDILGEQPVPGLVRYALEVELHMAHNDGELERTNTRPRGGVNRPCSNFS